ncbi:hypothetical protein PDE_04855 [Penicillium oxalicum 114-2]|uniref:Uncharacterized protein n=1 Tax=Penicillium oxalicum (strain 114-2 / CGMCC 5302) TaxID=933388 RepID=S7ZGW4_PENO1|nr:hypothetical protein PDE_04855 [Penicillium oxalicum 114-2]
MSSLESLEGGMSSCSNQVPRFNFLSGRNCGHRPYRASARLRVLRMKSISRFREAELPRHFPPFAQRGQRDNGENRSRQPRALQNRQSTVNALPIHTRVYHAPISHPPLSTPYSLWPSMVPQPSPPRNTQFIHS